MMNRILLLFVVLSTSLLSGCSNDDDNNASESNNNFLKIGNSEYELKAGSVENYGEYQAGIYNFDIVLISTAVNLVNGEFVPEDQVFSGIYFELFTSDQGDLAVGTYTQVPFEDIDAQTFEYSEVIQDAEIDNEDETGIFSELVQGSIDVIKNGPEYEFEFSGVDDLGRSISGYYKGTLVSID